MSWLSSLTAVFVLMSACAKPAQYVRGTTIPYSAANQAVLDTCEKYRSAVQRQDVEELLLMTHPRYEEDSGTPAGHDDYGRIGLQTVLKTRFLKASDIRYSVRYVAVHQQCKRELVKTCRAAVDILIDASYTVVNAQGRPTRLDKRDQNQIVLEWDGQRWLILKGL